MANTSKLGNAHNDKKQIIVPDTKGWHGKFRDMFLFFFNFYKNMLWPLIKTAYEGSQHFIFSWRIKKKLSLTSYHQSLPNIKFCSCRLCLNIKNTCQCFVSVNEKQQQHNKYRWIADTILRLCHQIFIISGQCQDDNEKLLQWNPFEKSPTLKVSRTQMDDLRFYVLFNNISVISGQWEGDYERLSAIEPCLLFKRFPPSVRLEPGAARSAGNPFSYWGS